MARIIRRRVSGLTTVTFNSSQSWVVPVGVTLLASMSGKGAAGSTTGASTPGYYTFYTVEITYQPGYGTDSYQGSTYQGFTAAGSAPADSCTTEYESVSRKTTKTCYSHYYDDGSPSNTTGASTTFVGATVNKTFPGSTGPVAAPTTSFTNVATTPGETVTVTIASGGTLTIAY